MKRPLFKKNKETLFDIYNLAIEDQPYLFLNIDLASKDINKTCHIRFDKVLKIKDASRNDVWYVKMVRTGDYSSGKIYKIVSAQTDDIYIYILVARVRNYYQWD